MNILVAMSGGVDSSVAAALLKEQGHRVIGATLKLLRQETGFGCCGSTRDIEDARAVCSRLGMPHYVLDFAADFQKNILDPFVYSYVSGETPNPCIACNRFKMCIRDRMKAAVAHLEPKMDKADRTARGTLLLATVKGDVHDIGKNLVHIILKNNGFNICLLYTSRCV